MMALSVYPRACGGTPYTLADKGEVAGLSPRVRGNRIGSSQRYIAQGSIPARAGEPPVPLQLEQGMPVYPRACGGTSAEIPIIPFTVGLSPRVRGNRVIAGLGLGLGRSIPARAGEPPCAPSSSDGSWVYPRACGGTPANVIVEEHGAGLSPRVRGNRRAGHGGEPRCRSIPARAGEPEYCRRP